MLQLFELKKINQDFYQPYSFIKPKILFSKENLEKILSILSKKNIGNSYSGIQGFTGEYLTRICLNYHLDRIIGHGKFLNLEGKLIKGKKDYIIKKSNKYILKLQNQREVLILKDNNFSQNSFDDEKFGIINIAEIDGLYLIKERRFNQKHTKKFIILENKTGNDSLDPHHIFKNINQPFLELYENSEIFYLLVNFDNYIYSNSKKQILKPYYREFHEELKELGVKNSIIHHPYRKENLTKFSKKIEERLNNQINGNVIWDLKNNQIIIFDEYGNKYEGKFQLN